jgi:predicted ribonuclease YlaK
MSNKKHNKLPERHNDFVEYFKPKNKKQQEFIELIKSKEIVIATGVAGSGKTITALASALSLLGEIYKKIILVKSVVTIPGEAIGFIPGSYEDKMEPFIMSYT